MGKKWKQWHIFIFLCTKISVDGDYSHKIQILSPWKKRYVKPRQCIKKQRHHFADKGAYSQNYGFPSSHAWVLGLDHKKGWVPKNWCFQIMVLEKTLESPLNSKKIKPVRPKVSQSWLFLEALTLKLKLQYFGHLIWTADSLDKTLILGKTEGMRRKGQ